jgi:hypothetical protein
MQTGYPYAPESVEVRPVHRVGNGVEGAPMPQGREKSSRREDIYNVG